MNLEGKRVLLKLSGEALGGGSDSSLHPETLGRIALELLHVVKNYHVQIAVVVGGGNFLRGASLPFHDRVVSDHMGMLATVINALALTRSINGAGGTARAFSSIEIPGVIKGYMKTDVLEVMGKGHIAALGGGTGATFFTTDTASALRAAELDADIILKATKVDGIYSADPEKNSDAIRYSTISYREVLEKGLAFMDSTAISFCMDNQIPILVFDMTVPGNLVKIIENTSIGSLVTP